jgi:regulatory protein
MCIENYTRCYQAAISLLARREHSRRELISKIRRKPFSEDVDLASLCDDLEESNYLSNKRFAEMFVHSRVARGQGVIKISYELRQRGVSDELIESAILAEGVDWLALAREQREKRFGLKKPKDIKERARQSRFLAGRGFSAEIINLVFA